MRVMSATLKEIRHQKQRGAASEAQRDRRGVKTVTKLTVSSEYGSPARMRTDKTNRRNFSFSYMQLCSVAFYFTYSLGPGGTVLPLKLKAIN